MLLCTFQLLKRFLCLLAQDLAPVTTAIAVVLVDYFPGTEPELGVSPRWDQHTRHFLQNKGLVVGLG